MKKKSAKTKKASKASTLYLYGISPSVKKAIEIQAEAVDGSAPIEAIRIAGFDAWISRVDRSEFADHLAENMENLEWLAMVGVRHQRAVADLAAKAEILPVRFGTVFLSEESLHEHVEGQKKSIQSVFKRIVGAEEWGVKIFRTTAAKAPAMIEASSGTDYLKRKAQTVMPRKKEEDPALAEFVKELGGVSVEAAPGGHASTGQPNLAWHGSFLVKRTGRKKFEAALKKFTARLADNYRVECSGPWPPYSFVGQNG